MNDVKLLSHFSVPRWPLVNKLNGIAKCLDVKLVHAATLEKLQYNLKSLSAKRALLLTDEGMLPYIEEIHRHSWPFELDVALFIQSKMSKVALELHQLPRVKYLLEFDETDSFAGRHLAVLVKKFTEQNILNLNKYLGFGAVLHTRTIDSSQTKRHAVEQIHHFINNLGETTYPHPFGEYARRISEMVDELVINAIFGANPRMHEADRSKAFSLSESEQIELSWGYDGEYFGVGVRDPFGQFDLDTIMKYISSQAKVENILPGKSAGLGLKVIFDRAHQIITNVQKRKVTEVIAVVKFENRLLDFEKTKKSFFYFTDGTVDLKLKAK
jgi:hypothetical protein